MKKSKSVDSYFSRIVEIRDQLGNVGEVVPDKELSIYILRGLPNTWESFVQTVTGHDTFPSMIGYGQIVQKKNRDLWQRMERLVKKIKRL